MPLTDAEKLQILNYSGLRVGEDGHITDWQDQPPRHGKPIGQNAGEPRVLRFPFTAQEDQELKEWCTAARREGVRGDRVYEQLEAVCPSHPWQAYRNRWRKTLRYTLLPDFTFDDPYPHLDDDSFGNVVLEHAYRHEVCEIAQEQEQKQEQKQEHEQEQGQRPQEEGIAKHDPCLDGREVLKKIGVRDDAELRQLLRAPWVARVYKDLRSAETSDDVGLLHRAAQQSSQSEVSLLAVKLEAALCVLNKPAGVPPIDAVQSDATFCQVEDHEIRFLVCAAQSGSDLGCIWNDKKRLCGWRGPCESALWLLLWFQWIHKDTIVQRLQHTREIWRAFMDDLVGGAHSQTLIVPSISVSRAPPLSNESICPQDPASGMRNVVLTQSSSRRAAKLQVERQTFLLSDQARGIYLSDRDGRLKAWGVSAGHRGTCVLVPATWAWNNPVSLLDHPDAWPADEPGTPRLKLSMGSFSFHWARVAAWFEQWPRTTGELQYFLPPNDCREDPSPMHGSHLCHHGLCINPTHIAYEEKTTNLERASCLTAASTLRSYHAVIPRNCSRHEPPCLLQLAALTTFETLSIQFNILRIASGIGAAMTYLQPASHPSRYESFEQGPEPSRLFPDVGIQRDEIVHIQRPDVVNDPHLLHWTCGLCAYPRAFRRLTSLWSHLKTGHRATEQSVILEQVARSAKVNQTWAERHSYNYERDNPAMWEKMVQAQSAGFTWEVFSAWRFTRGRCDRETDSPTPGGALQ